MSRVLLLAATRKGAFVLESDADRTAWTVLRHGLREWEVTDLLVDPVAPDRLYAAVGRFMDEPAVHRSDDLGGTWAPTATAPTYPDDGAELNRIWTLVSGHRAEPGTLYAGVDEAGVFVSRDGGDRWAALTGLTDHPTRDGWFPGTGGLCCHSVVADPDDPDRLWVGISAVGVFRTEDGGATWTLCNDGLEVIVPSADHAGLGSCVHRLVNDPSDPERLFQQNHRGVYRSTDGATTWDRIDAGLPSSFGFPLVVHPRDTSTLYTFPLESDARRVPIDGRPAVYRTTDDGETWERLDHGLPTDAWVTVLRQAMAVDDLDPVGVYFGTTGGDLFVSRDEGDSWARIDCRLPRISSLRVAVVD